jgi:hypothetical protein
MKSTGRPPAGEFSHGDTACEQWMAMEPSHGDRLSEQRIVREPFHGNKKSDQQISILVLTSNSVWCSSERVFNDRVKMNH